MTTPPASTNSQPPQLQFISDADASTFRDSPFSLNETILRSFDHNRTGVTSLNELSEFCVDHKNPETLVSYFLFKLGPTGVTDNINSIISLHRFGHFMSNRLQQDPQHVYTGTVMDTKSFDSALKTGALDSRRRLLWHSAELVALHFPEHSQGNNTPPTTLTTNVTPISTGSTTIVPPSTSVSVPSSTGLVPAQTAAYPHLVPVTPVPHSRATTGHVTPGPANRTGMRHSVPTPATRRELYAAQHHASVPHVPGQQYGVLYPPPPQMRRSVPNPATRRELYEQYASQHHASALHVPSPQYGVTYASTLHMRPAVPTPATYWHAHTPQVHPPAPQVPSPQYGYTYPSQSQMTHVVPTPAIPVTGPRAPTLPPTPLASTLTCTSSSVSHTITTPTSTGIAVRTPRGVSDPSIPVLRGDEPVTPDLPVPSTTPTPTPSEKLDFLLSINDAANAASRGGSGDEVVVVRNHESQCDDNSKQITRLLMSTPEIDTTVTSATTGRDVSRQTTRPSIQCSSNDTNVCNIITTSTIDERTIDYDSVFLNSHLEARIIALEHDLDLATSSSRNKWTSHDDCQNHAVDITTAIAQLEVELGLCHTSTTSSLHSGHDSESLRTIDLHNYSHNSTSHDSIYYDDLSRPVLRQHMGCSGIQWYVLVPCACTGEHTGRPPGSLTCGAHFDALLRQADLYTRISFQGEYIKLPPDLHFRGAQLLHPFNNSTK